MKNKIKDWLFYLYYLAVASWVRDLGHTLYILRKFLHKNLYKSMS